MAGEGFVPVMLCILVSVYHPYRWVAPLTARLIEEFWPDHPPVFFCGLTSEEAGDLPHVACREEPHPRSWAGFVKDACAELRGRGFTQCYFLGEDHAPLAPCDSGYLLGTLPRLLEELGGVYAGLMGWDNRRYTTRAPVLGKEHGRMMHLTVPEAPRFHLHPSLWRLEVLEACAQLVTRGPKHTPWQFERVCDRPDADLPEKWKRGCYQICADALLPAPGWRKAGRAVERFVFHRLMALYPVARKLGEGPEFWDAVGFDDFFYPGPYPMFYSGVMSRGRLNPFLRRWLGRRVNPHPLLVEVMRVSDQMAGKVAQPSWL